jgi:hypothetical protein
LPFAGEEVVDRARELRMREPVRRPRLHRQQAARHLVLALRAAFEAQVAVGDAPGERLVVAGVEVQAADVLDRAPVAAERGLALGVDRDQRGRDAALAAAGRRRAASSRPSSPPCAAKKSRVRYGVEWWRDR